MATDSNVACLVLRDLSERLLLDARDNSKKLSKRGRRSFRNILSSVVWFHLMERNHNRGISVPDHEIEWGTWGDGPGQFYVNVIVHGDGDIEPAPIATEIKRALGLDFCVSIYKVHAHFGAK